jgi:hypothetical protein
MQLKLKAMFSAIGSVVPCRLADPIMLSGTRIALDDVYSLSRGSVVPT